MKKLILFLNPLDIVWKAAREARREKADENAVEDLPPVFSITLPLLDTLRIYWPFSRTTSRTIHYTGL